MNIGSVRVNTTESPNSHDSISLGYIVGDGLLGEAVAAIWKLVDAATVYGHHGTADGLENAWPRVYNALKAIEKAVK